jgi:hypothetical protein
MTGKGCRKFVENLAFLELRRPICEATSGGLGNGPYFWNQCVEGYAGIYIVLGFGNFLEFLNFGIYFRI